MTKHKGCESMKTICHRKLLLTPVKRPRFANMIKEKLTILPGGCISFTVPREVLFVEQ